MHLLSNIILEVKLEMWLGICDTFLLMTQTAVLLEDCIFSYFNCALFPRKKYFLLISCTIIFFLKPQHYRIKLSAIKFPIMLQSILKGLARGYG